ncbi:MAG: ComF family protein [Bacteroidales bacterium]
MRVLQYIEDVVFPPVCDGCGGKLLGAEKILCVKCLSSLPYNMALEFDNNLIKLSPGVPFMSLFTYQKGNLAQRLIYKLKYDGRKDIGVFLGRIVGENLNKTKAHIDFVLPIPLTSVKFMIRGFNQSEMIARGISEVIKAPVNTNILRRRMGLRSQTRLNKWKRWENVEEKFFVSPNNPIPKQSSVLVVDDVFTTGATITSCVRPAIDKFSKIYACALASASR